MSIDGPGGSSADLRITEDLQSLDDALQDCGGRMAAVPSLSAGSAVLLALVAERDPVVPVLFLDTAMHVPQTLASKRRRGDVKTERGIHQPGRATTAGAP